MFVRRSRFVFASLLVFLSTAAFYHDPGSIPWLVIVGGVLLAVVGAVVWGVWSARKGDGEGGPPFK